MKTKTKKPTKRESAKTKQPPTVEMHAEHAEKVSQIDAAVEVLGKSREPMTCKAMVEAMTTKGLWSSPNGKTPEATLYSAILREIATKGKDARFVKTAPGRFAARR